MPRFSSTTSTVVRFSRRSPIATIHSHRFNEVHGTTGHVFERRFHSKPIDYDSHLWLTFRYIALNPFRAGMVRDHDRYPWSAHAALAGVGPPHRALDRDAALWYFDDSPVRYRAYVAEGTGLPERPELASFISADLDALRLAIYYGYNQSEIAAALGVNQATVSRWLNA